MSSSSASSSRSLASSPASSLSSASSAWTPTSLRLSTMNTSATRPPPAHQHAPAPSTIASLPSLAHSLSAFPTMTVVTNDMVHYSMLGSTKGASEAKLNSALRRTKQRQDAGPGAKVSASHAVLNAVAWAADRLNATLQVSASNANPRARYPTPEDDEPVLLIVPKRSKGKQSS